MILAAWGCGNGNIEGCKPGGKRSSWDWVEGHGEWLVWVRDGWKCRENAEVGNVSFVTILPSG